MRWRHFFLYDDITVLWIRKKIKYLNVKIIDMFLSNISAVISIDFKMLVMSLCLCFREQSDVSLVMKWHWQNIGEEHKLFYLILIFSNLQ